MTDTNKGIFALFLASFFWGGTFISTKLVLQHIDASVLLFFRAILTSVILYVIMFSAINKEFASMFRSRDLWLFSLASSAAIYLQTEGLRYTSATNSAFNTALFIVFIPLIQKIAMKMKIPGRFYSAVIIAIAGLYLISYGFRRPDSINFGDFLSLLCALSYAYAILLLEQISNRFSAYGIVFFSFAIVALTTLLPAFKDILGSDISLACSPSVIINIIYLATLGGIVPYSLMAIGQRSVPPGLAGLIYNFEPVFTMILAFLSLGEKLTAAKIAGCAIILSSIFVGKKK